MLVFVPTIMKDSESFCCLKRPCQFCLISMPLSYHQCRLSFGNFILTFDEAAVMSSSHKLVLRSKLRHPRRTQVQALLASLLLLILRPRKIANVNSYGDLGMRNSSTHSHSHRHEHFLPAAHKSFSIPWQDWPLPADSVAAPPPSCLSTNTSPIDQRPLERLLWTPLWHVVTQPRGSCASFSSPRAPLPSALILWSWRARYSDKARSVGREPVKKG